MSHIEVPRTVDYDTYTYIHGGNAIVQCLNIQACPPPRKA